MDVVPRWHLPAIVAAFFLAAAMYSVTLPMWEGPDESEHFQYVYYLVAHHALPTTDLPTIQPDGNNEGKQPPLYYVLAAPLVAGIDLSGIDRIRTNPHAGWDGMADAHYSVVHVQDEGWPYHGIFLAGHLIRLLSALFGAVTVALTYGCATTATGSRRLGIFAALFVACLPNFLLTSATIDNDSLTDTIGAALLYCALRANRRNGESTIPAFGLASGLALLTKLSLALPVVLGFLAIVAALPTPRRRTLALAAWPFLPAFAFWSWRIKLGERELIGRPLGGISSHPGPVGALTWAAPMQFAEHVITTFVAYFGWASVALPGWYYAAACLFLTFGLAGWIPGRPWRAGKELGVPTILLLWGLPLLFLIAMIAAAVTVTAAGSTYANSRLLYPALPAIATLVAYGWGRWAASLAVLRRLASLALTLAAGVAIAVPLIVLRPFQPAPWPVSDRPPPTATPVIGAQFTGYAALVADHLPPGPFTAGTGIYVTLYWRVARPLPAGEWLFVHVEDRQGIRVAAFDGPPSSSTLPLASWRKGDVVAETEVLTFHQDAAPGRYQVVVGWYNPKSGERLPVTGGATEALAGDVLVGPAKP